MGARRGERGDGNLGCILWLLLLVVAGLVLWKAVPVKIANAELYDHMVELAKFSGNWTEEKLRKSILDKALEKGLPVTPKQISVTKTRDRIIMDCSYTVMLEFPGYTYEWKVDHKVDRPIYRL